MVLGGQEGKLGDCGLAGHVAAGDEAQLDRHVASRVDIEDHALVHLADVDNHHSILLLLLEIRKQPIVERPLGWHVPDSIGLNHQVLQLLLDRHSEGRQLQMPDFRA